MEIIFLGTSSGTPTKTRNVSAIAIRKYNAKQWSLVDCGEDTQHQILHTNLSLKNLDAIYITHIHGDHCYGLPGLLASATMAGRVEALTLIAPNAVKLFLETMQTHTELRLSFDIDFICTEEHVGDIQRGDFKVQTVALSHRVPSWGYLFEEKEIEVKLDTQKLLADNIPKGLLWGRFQKEEEVILENGKVIQSKMYHLPQRKARKIAISGDNDTPEIWGNIDGVDLLIHEATYTDEIGKKVGKEVGHSTAKQVAIFAQNYGLKNLILTHFSPRYQDDITKDGSIQELEYEAKTFYKQHLFLAHDFALYRLDKDTNVSYYYEI
jgi:ribonuclease Z